MSTWYRTADRIALLFSIAIHVEHSNYQLHAVHWTGCNSNSVGITQWNKYTHRTLSSKTQQFPLIEKKLFGPWWRKKKTRKQERKANRIITLDGENNKKVEWQHDIGLRNFAWTKSRWKPQSGSKLKTDRLSAMILHSQFNLAIQFWRQGKFCHLR